MPAVPVALAAPAVELASCTVAVKRYAPRSGVGMPEWHRGPLASWQAVRSDASNAPGRTRIDRTDSPRRMSTMPSTAPTPTTDTDRDTSPTPTRMGRPPISDIAPGEKTPQRQIRIADEDWYGAAAKAAEAGTTSSDVVRRLLRAWRLGEIDLPE